MCCVCFSCRCVALFQVVLSLQQIVLLDHYTNHPHIFRSPYFAKQSHLLSPTSSSSSLFSLLARASPAPDFGPCLCLFHAHIARQTAALNDAPPSLVSAAHDGAGPSSTRPTPQSLRFTPSLAMTLALSTAAEAARLRKLGWLFQSKSAPSSSSSSSTSSSSSSSSASSRALSRFDEWLAFAWDQRDHALLYSLACLAQRSQVRCAHPIPFSHEREAERKRQMLKPHLLVWLLCVCSSSCRVFCSQYSLLDCCLT